MLRGSGEVRSVRRPLHRVRGEAENALRNALVAAKVFFTDCADYGALSPDAIDAIEWTLAYEDAPSASMDVISIRAVAARALVPVTRADDGSVRCLADDADTGLVTYGNDRAARPSDCTGRLARLGRHRLNRSA